MKNETDLIDSFWETISSRLDLPVTQTSFFLITLALILTLILLIFILCSAFKYIKKNNSTRNAKFDSLLEINLDKLEETNSFESFNDLFTKCKHLEYPYDKLIFIRDIGCGEFGRIVQAKAPNLTKNVNNLQSKNSKNDNISINIDPIINEDDDYTIVAVKMLRKSEHRKILKKNLIKEAYLMAQFQHPNLIKLLGISITPQEPIYLLFEYMSKGDLNAFLRFRAPSNQLSSSNFRKDNYVLNDLNLLKLAKQIADGMKYLSNLNFVHRALCTQNCLINDDLIVKISDFGLSQKLSEQNNEFKNLNLNLKKKNCKKIKQNGLENENKELITNNKLPIRWMAIEAILNDTFSIKSDVWSFGIVLWEIFNFAQQPYSDLKENKDVVKFILNGNRLTRPNLCCNKLFNVMKKCWNNKPEKRPTFSKILIQLHKIENDLSKKHVRTLKQEKKQNTQSSLNTIYV